MRLSIVEKCNQALKTFKFPQTIERILPHTINIVNRCDTSVLQGNTAVLQNKSSGTSSGTFGGGSGTGSGNPAPYFWYYLLLRDEDNFNFLFGFCDDYKIYKWKQGKKKLSYKEMKKIRAEVGGKIREIANNDFSSFGGAL
jgi:hypothetical protein